MKACLEVSNTAGLVSESMKRLERRGVGVWLILLGAALFSGCERKSEMEEIALALPDWRNPESCRSCHESAFSAWKESHHAKANRWIDLKRDADAFAVGDIQVDGGNRYRFEHDSEGARIVELGEEERVSEIAMWIGETPLKQAVVAGERGRWQAHSLAWDEVRKQWFSVFGDEVRERGEWGHWTGQGMNWNSNCAACHMTEYEKGYVAAEDRYESDWSAQGIGCIRCHENMETHLEDAIAGKPFVKGGERGYGELMGNCASCHSRRTELTDTIFSAGDEFSEKYRLLLYDHPTAYFPDGRAQEEDFVYGSFVHSKMSHAGVSCFDCHEPHGGKLVLPAENNALCIQCHSTGKMGATMVEVESHSGHSAGSEGAQCVACHMPERSYMERDSRRDHGFTIPDPVLARAYGMPDTCLSCHEARGSDWVEGEFERMFGESERVQALRKRAAVLDATWTGRMEAADELLALWEAESNVYWRASYLRLMRGFVSDVRVRAAIEASLEAEAAIERDAAVYALAAVEGAEALLAGIDEDESLMVRLQAAEVLSRVGGMSDELGAEYERFLQANADRPFGALRLGELAAQAGRREEAERWIERAVRFDRRNPELRYEAAILFDRIGMPELALRHLRLASGYAPEDGKIVFAMGLTLGELGDYQGSLEALERAVALDGSQDRWWYNLAMMQEYLGNRVGAGESLRRAIELAPAVEEYREARERLR